MNARTAKLLSRFATLTVPRDWDGQDKLRNKNDLRPGQWFDPRRRHLKRLKRQWNDMTPKEREAKRKEYQGILIWAMKEGRTHVRIKEES